MGSLASGFAIVRQHKRLKRDWSRFTHQTRRRIYASLSSSNDLPRVLQLWQELVDALENGKAVEARAAMRGLVVRALDGLGLPSGF